MSADRASHRHRAAAHSDGGLTVPLDGAAEIRGGMRDPDGFLIEVGRATGLVEGRLAEQPSAGGEAGGTDGR